ncbi:MAG: arginine--tRNA ligase [Clostridia bacterium]|nr:arginine--tRNA ligase [Clostridia bacterium]
MTEFKHNIASSVKNAIAKLYPAAVISEEEIFGMLEYPPDDTMGDVAFPCFKLSRTLRAAPPKIAAALFAELEAMPPKGAGKVQLVGGYINFFASCEFFAESVLAPLCEKGADYGRTDEGAGKTVVLDYSSPNTAKPFHIGHLGTTVIGHSLKLLHEYRGYSCVGINHLGDWGTQFGKLITAYRKWGSREDIETGGIDKLVELYVKFHEEAEKDPALGDEARAEFTKLEHGDEENLALWRWFIDISLAEYQKTYAQLGITFDSYNGESFYTDKMPEQVELLREKNLMKIDDGASIVDLSEYNMPPCLILKRDGSTLYPTRDIAAAVYRDRTYHFDKCIYVTSAGQSLHFAQWFKVVELMGYDFASKLYHVPYGTVSIGGEKLATRTGNVILLRDLFATSVEKVRAIMEEKNPNMQNKDEAAEAVGVGAIVFYYLSSNRIRDINFVMEEALDFNGNTGPYAQYTYARTCSILSKLGEEAAGAKAPLCTSLDKTERDLMKTFSLFPEKVDEAIAGMEPSIVTRYILELCGAFNRFYQACPIATCEDAEKRALRISLTRGTRDILGKALELICIKHPEKI